MGNHGHDIHFLLIALILGFFVTVLSINQVNPDMMTGNVAAAKADMQNDKAVNSLIKWTTTHAEIKALNTDGVAKINIDTPKLKRPDFNIGGRAVNVPEGKSSCEWVNIYHDDLSDLKSLTGHDVCGQIGYKACLMTNTEKTTTYYSSGDGSCADMIFKDDSNHLDNCDKRLKSYGTACIAGEHDLSESAYTTVFCCR